jgi:hypothetical protein
MEPRQDVHGRYSGLRRAAAALAAASFAVDPAEGRRFGYEDRQKDPIGNVPFEKVAR